MAATELASKVAVIETPPAVRQIQGAATAVFGMVGVAERGPIGTPVLVTSFAEYTKHFGGYLNIATAHLAQAVRAFFAEGSGQLWVVRTAHYTDVLDPTTLTAVRSTKNLVTPGAATPARISGGAAPFAMVDGDTLVFSVDGGPDDTATFNGTAEQVQSAGVFPLALADGQTLLITMDGGAQQTVTFAAADPLIAVIGAVTLGEATAVIAQQINDAKVWNDGADIFIESEIEGTDSSVSVDGGTAAAAFAFAESVAGAGSVANLAAVTADEVKTLVEAAALPGEVVVDESGGLLRISTGDTGLAATLEVKGATADAFGFVEDVVQTGADSSSVDVYTVEGKTHGTYADGAAVAVAAATSGEAARFNTTVTIDGVVKETFVNLSPDPTDDRYAVDIVNAGSDLIRLTDLDVVGNPRPDNQSIVLAGGNDGLVDLDDNDFLGGSSDAGRTGLRALDLTLDLTVIAIPGRASAAVASGMLAYCDNTRDGEVFAVIDVPQAQDRTEVITWVETTAALIGASEQGAVYWPWCKVLNPSKSIFGNEDTITIAPSGLICGRMAKGDGARPGGVYDPPAGSDGPGVLLSVLGVEDEAVLEEATRDLVYPKRINPITTAPGRSYYVDGSRTLKGDGNFPNINERRGVNFIKRSLRRGLDFARFKRNGESLRASVRRTMISFLVTQMQRGAFRSEEPEDAFQVVCDTTNNSTADEFAGRLNAKALLATAKPTEYVIIEITQDTRAL